MSLKSPPDITVYDIADWFLAKAHSEGRYLKQMKLQKLVYFAYGWYYAFFDQSLFKESIFAWKHGPVVNDLYHKYKCFKKNPIMETGQQQDFCKSVESMLDYVWRTYEPYSDFFLSEITHRKESPWTQFYRKGELFSAIPSESIRDYFKTLVSEYEYV